MTRLKDSIIMSDKKGYQRIHKSMDEFEFRSDPISSKKGHGVSVFELSCSCQNYAWGKVGNDSEVAKLLQSADPGFELVPDEPYAELWMGTHPNGPSSVKIPGQPDKSLEDWLHKNPDALGTRMKDYFKGALPFLFKVLSVNNSLSVQAHPNKVLAEKLHKSHPDMYKDANHKPEMAIALTDFQALCGFRPVQEIAKFIEEIGEFEAVVGHHNAVLLISASKCHDMPLQLKAVRDCFTGMMTTNREQVETQLKLLVDRVKSMKSEGKDTSHLHGDVLLKLDREFPGDVGGFAIYFLNIIKLNKGDAMYLEANLPHAYLSGDCMECMACSDNVVRAGLTHKYIDVETLCKMLDYSGKPLEKTKFKGKVSKDDKGCTISSFTPPIWDFAVTEIEVPENVKSFKLQSMDSASIVIFIEGKGTLSNRTIDQSIPVKRGTVVFISAEEEASIEVSSNGMWLFRAHGG